MKLLSSVYINLSVLVLLHAEESRYCFLIPAATEVREFDTIEVNVSTLHPIDEPIRLVAKDRDNKTLLNITMNCENCQSEPSTRVELQEIEKKNHYKVLIHEAQLSDSAEYVCYVEEKENSDRLSINVVQPSTSVAPDRSTPRDAIDIEQVKVNQPTTTGRNAPNPLTPGHLSTQASNQATRGFELPLKTGIIISGFGCVVVLLCRFCLQEIVHFTDL